MNISVMAIGASLGVIAVLVALCVRFPRDDRKGDASKDILNARDMRFLLNDGILVDASPGGLLVLGRDSCQGLTWDDLRDVLLARFPELPRLPPAASERHESRDGHATLLVERFDEALSVRLSESRAGDADRHLAYTLRAELAPLRTATDAAQALIWKCDADGNVIWSNRTYRTLAESLGFGDERQPLLAGAGPQPTDGAPVRAKLTQPDGPDSWYEVRAVPQDDEVLYFAAPIDAIVRAERAQQNFVQTLTKTFAHLPIGLVVFDRNRQLALFNPALIDLTNLPPEFLSGRPNLMTFFDHMREARMMPEPKNYSSWRERLTDLVRAAEGDRFSETWTLPTGLTYKITGRPHPDGAVAFLIEDISAEISLTRRFRAELGQTQAVLDALPDAVAVFSRLGVLTSCNAAYSANWSGAEQPRLADVTVTEERRVWQDKCTGDLPWSAICEMVFNESDRTVWEGSVAHNDLGAVRVYVSSVSGGSTLVRFVTAQEPPRTSAPALGQTNGTSSVVAV